jgi:hypothetical protein
MARLIIVFLSLFSSILGCSSSKDQIRSVLEQDRATSTSSSSIADIAAKMRAIDLSNCPADFQDAYIAHTQDWERLANWEQQAIGFNKNYVSGGAMVESMVRGFLGDPFGKTNEGFAEQNRLQAIHQQLNTEIQRSFQQVELVARKHGVALPSKRANKP